MEYGMYPNPNTGLFTIIFREPINEALRIRVVDVLGKEVFSKDIDRLNSKDLNLDIEGLNDGTYMVILQSDKHQYRDQKFVVIH
jgi:hypothetical protein